MSASNKEDILGWCIKYRGPINSVGCGEWSAGGTRRRSVRLLKGGHWARILRAC